MLLFDGQFASGLPLHVFLEETFTVARVERSLCSKLGRFEVGDEGAFFDLLLLEGPSTFLEKFLSFLPDGFVLN